MVSPPRADTGGMTPLTQTELSALQLAGRGYSMQESAHILRKSSETVKSQLGVARLKLGARNTTHAVVIALDAGYIAA